MSIRFSGIRKTDRFFPHRHQIGFRRFIQELVKYERIPALRSIISVGCQKHLSAKAAKAGVIMEVE